MLYDGVEVVDGFRLFRPARDSAYLFNCADPRWTPAGMNIVTKELARRLSRYGFAIRAAHQPPIVKTHKAPCVFYDLANALYGYGQSMLTPQQLALAEHAQDKTMEEVRLLDNRMVPEDQNSPVLVIGNCYVENFREQLVRELNMLVASHWAPNQSTQAFEDFLREPELLNHKQVVVWITTEQHLTRFKPLPPPVLKALQTDK
jgi:hypothetical protein